MNKEFVWTDALVKKYIKLYTRNWWRGDITDKEIQEFKESETTIPDWEIMSMMYESDRDDEITVFERLEDGKFKSDRWPEESFDLHDDLLNNKNGKKYLIRSVKRLPDGEVFTIKDRVDAKQAGIKEIKKFFMGGDYCNLWVQFNEGHGSNDGCLGLNSIEKLKPLFTTYDGIDIFDKNELLYVVEHARDVFLFESKSTAGSIRGILKYFYYKEPAEQYVIIHKPCLSISEVIDAGPAHDIDPVLKNNLLKLVKKKIEGK